MKKICHLLANIVIPVYKPVLDSRYVDLLAAIYHDWFQETSIENSYKPSSFTLKGLKNPSCYFILVRLIPDLFFGLFLFPLLGISRILSINSYHALLLSIAIIFVKCIFTQYLCNLYLETAVILTGKNYNYRVYIQCWIILKIQSTFQHKYF